MEGQTYVGTYQGLAPEGHVLVAPDGSRVVLEPAPILDARLHNVPVGVKVKVEKTERTVSSKSGRKVADYSVFVAKGSLDGVRRAVVALLGGTPEEEVPPVPLPPDPEAIRRALLAEAERRRAEEQERERQVAWLRQEAARLGYRLVKKHPVT